MALFKKVVWKQVEISVHIHNHALAMALVHNLCAEKYKRSFIFRNRKRSL